MINSSFTLLLPYFNYNDGFKNVPPHPAFSLLTLGCTTVCFLKLISYGHTNYWCRLQYLGGNTKLRRRKSFSTSEGKVKQRSWLSYVLTIVLYFHVFIKKNFFQCFHLAAHLRVRLSWFTCL